MSHSPSASDTLLFTDPFSAPIDVFGQKSRRTTSISYNPRDRSQKQRPLLVVVPPSILNQHHGQLGNVLSLGPTQRLSHGIVMPLYPTMYAQLTAIAREFGFPSTSGLCLYLYYSENGLTVTPRISDETWHSLWGSVFDAPPAGRTTPINGVIEFDIDLRQARWYSSWVSSSLKDHPPDLSSSACPNTVTPDSRRRGDSRATVDDEHVDDRRDTPTPHRAPSYSQRQHFPKRLSLVERIDVVNPRMVSSSPSPSPSPEKLVALAQVLSPIVQESEPRTARQDLQTRVQSWRVSAMLEPTPLPVTGQPSLEPTNIPHTLQIEVPAEETDVLKLEDYSWSISSAGPEDRESLSSAHSDHISSVYLEDILAGSVCSTPSVCTTIDHVDYGFDSPNNVVCGLPSPDIAQRVIESAPLTPMTATTWGAPSYPPSPAVLTVPTTPDIGHRVFDEMQWWPHCDFPPESQIVQKSSQSLETLYPHLCIYPAVYPFFDLYPAVAGASTSAPDRSTGGTALSVTLKDYPSFNLYPAVYPSLDIYPSMLQITPLSTRCESSEISVAINARSYPNFNLYPPVYPFLDIYPPTTKDTYPLSLHTVLLSTRSESNEISLSLGVQYPAFNLYPPVYPFMNIYPSVVKLDDSPPVQVELLSLSICCHSYPVFDLYPAVYPHFNLYPQ
ncbi:hypothetical protein F5887DRAFT_207082 [Amanita rubescens]|nr:hypothetical protein F5887DRAFT_207082 [Amanita rubescens]